MGEKRLEEFFFPLRILTSMFDAKFRLEVAADKGRDGASSATFQDEPRGVAATLAAPPAAAPPGSGA